RPVTGQRVQPRRGHPGRHAGPGQCRTTFGARKAAVDGAVVGSSNTTSTSHLPAPTICESFRRGVRTARWGASTSGGGGRALFSTSGGSGRAAQAGAGGAAWTAIWG